MPKLVNNLATDVNEKLTKKEYVAFGASTAISKVSTAMSGFFGGLVAQHF
jgi:hypothetical protein